jgi:hypothetical protein
MRTGVGLALFVVLSCLAPLALAAPAPTAPATLKTILFGKSVTMKAKKPTDVGGTPLALVLAKACGFKDWAEVAMPKVPASGTLLYTTGPTLNTLYRVMIADRVVVNLTVHVQPLITLLHAGSKYSVNVTTGNGAGLGGRTVSLEQKSLKGRWTKVGTVKLKLISRPDQINAVATGLGSVRLTGRGPVRASLPAKQAAPCFAPVVTAPLP